MIRCHVCIRQGCRSNLKCDLRGSWARYVHGVLYLVISESATYNTLRHGAINAEVSRSYAQCMSRLFMLAYSATDAKDLVVECKDNFKKEIDPLAVRAGNILNGH